MTIFNGVSSSNLFPQGSGDYAEEEVERMQEPEEMDDSKATASFRNCRSNAYTNL